MKACVVAASCAQVRKEPSKRQKRLEETGKKRSRAGHKVKTGENVVYIKSKRDSNA